MSLATLKKKAATKYSKNMGVSKIGFSLQGTHRNIGAVNPTNLSKTSTNTKFKGNLPRGSGGCCGGYTIITSKGACCVPQTTVKPSNKSARATIQTKYRWLTSSYPKTSVKNLYQDDQSTFIKKVRQEQLCVSVDTTNAVNQTTCSNDNNNNCIASYTKSPFYSTSAGEYTTTKGVSKYKVCLPFADRDNEYMCN